MKKYAAELYHYEWRNGQSRRIYKKLRYYSRKNPLTTQLEVCWWTPDLGHDHVYLALGADSPPHVVLALMLRTTNTQQRSSYCSRFMKILFGSLACDLSNVVAAAVFFFIHFWWLFKYSLSAAIWIAGFRPLFLLLGGTKVKPLPRKLK